jgi:hypothetical protein
MTGVVAGQQVTRDLAALATVYLQARTHYGIVEPATLDPLRAVWRAVLGEHDLNALDDLYAKLVWIPDGDLERLDEAAREYRRTVGEPDPPPNAGGDCQPGGSGEGGGRPIPANATAPTLAAEQPRGRSPTRSSRRSRPPAPAS